MTTIRYLRRKTSMRKMLRKVLMRQRNWTRYSRTAHVLWLFRWSRRYLHHSTMQKNDLYKREGKGRRYFLGNIISSILCSARYFAPGRFEEQANFHSILQLILVQISLFFVTSQHTNYFFYPLIYFKEEEKPASCF